MPVTMRGRLTAVNPLVKLAATLPPLLLVMFTRDPATPALLAAGALTAVLTGVHVRPRVLLIGAAAIALVGIWTTLLFALLARPDLVAGTPVILDGWITLRAGAVEIGAATALRLIAVSALALLGSAGTTTAGLASALVRQAHVPYRFAHGALAATRFVPRYRQDLATLRAAHRARGIIDPAGPVGFVRRTGRSAVPLLAAGARHAERLSLAMDARGFGAHPRRSDRDPATVRASDVLFLLSVWAGVAAVFAVTAAAGLLRWGGNLYGIA